MIKDSTGERVYSGTFNVRVPTELHKNLVDDAKKQGVSLNAWCNYLLAANRLNKLSEGKK